MTSDADHWQINATVYKDRVEETHYITDPARNIRREPVTKVWEVGDSMGWGSFGEVRQEKSKDDGKVRAVKRILLERIDMGSDEYMKELKALLEFSKPRYRDTGLFVQFLGWFRTSSEIFLAMEYIQLGDLEKNIKAHSGRISEIEARDITEQILSGLEIMHAESFAHRDLKPQNVLVVHGPPKWWIKLADFGLTKRLTESTALRTQKGTLPYMAPEIHPYLDPPATDHTNAIDLWAVGCITYRLVAGELLFSSVRPLTKYCKDKSLFPHDTLLKNGIQSSCSEFMEQLLAPHPKERPSASQALKHTWIMSGTRALQMLNEHTQNTAISQICKWNICGPRGVAFSPNGKLMASVSSHGRVIIWDRATDAVLNELFVITTSANSVIFSPDSKFIPVASEDHTVYLWNIVTGTYYYTHFKGHRSLISSMAFSPNGKVLASASQDRTVRLWDIATGSNLQILSDHIAEVLSVAFSPDSKMVVSGSLDMTVRLWDTATGSILQTFTGHTDWVQSVLFLSNNKVVVSASYDCTVRLWNILTGNILQLKGHTSSVNSLALSPNGRVLASASGDKTVQLWETTTGSNIHTLNGHTKGIWFVAFSPDGKSVASASKDDTVGLWDVTSLQYI